MADRIFERKFLKNHPVHPHRAEIIKISRIDDLLERMTVLTLNLEKADSLEFDKRDKLMAELYQIKEEIRQRCE